MAKCTIRSPETPDGSITPGNSILLVKYKGAAPAYATYENGEYVFDASDEICKAIDEGSLIVTFESYEGVPVMIHLTDNPLSPAPES